MICNSMKKSEIIGEHWVSASCIIIYCGANNPLTTNRLLGCHFDIASLPFSLHKIKLSFYSTPVSAVPSPVQTVTLVSEEPYHQTPDAVAPTDLNKTATELSDWLVLITQMLKSNIVTVGDIEEIRTTMGRLQVSLADVF